MGPLAAQATISRTAAENAHLEPSQPEDEAAKRPNQSLVVRTSSSMGFCDTTNTP